MDHETSQRNRRRFFELTNHGHESLQVFIVAAAIAIVLSVITVAILRDNKIDAEIALAEIAHDTAAIENGMIQELTAIPGKDYTPLVWRHPNDGED